MAVAQPQAEPGIDQRTLNDKLSFVPHSKPQDEYLYSTARFNIPCCGRRWGKTQPTGHRVTYKSFIPDAYVWIVGPTYKLGEKEFRVVFADYKKLNLLRYCRKSYNVKQGNMRIETPWNSVIEVVSAEKQDSLVGEGLTHAVMSEAAKHSRSTWEQYVEPALSDLLGSCDFPSTPQGFNWYHGLWMIAEQKALPGYRSWQMPSWTNLVRYPGGLNNPEIQRIKSLVSRVWFDQEYGAAFTAISGAIYEEWDESRNVQRCEYNPLLPNYVAFDYGFVNPFVALDIQVSPDDTVYVWREYYGRYKSTLEHAHILKNRTNPDDYKITQMWGDPRGADEEAILSMILGHVGSVHVPWKSSVEQIKRLLKPQAQSTPKLYIDPSCVNLIREMPQLHVKPLSRNLAKQDLDEHKDQGNIQHKVDDHCCDALRYFIGPHFVLGTGTHLSDVYGEDYQGSESQDVFTNLLGGSDSSGFTTLDQELTLGSRF